VRVPVRLDRPRLSDEEIERARRERREPRPTQWDHLHLAGLNRGMRSAVRRLPDAEGPVLDLYCGTKPYLELIPWRPLWGLDIDRHFGRADVLARVPIPFRDGSFGVVFCSQALHLVDDPVATVREMERVLRPGGHAIVTLPHVFVAEASIERHWSRNDLGVLFGRWRDVHVAGIDGPGAALALVVGHAAWLASRRWDRLRPAYLPVVVVMNVVCSTLDALLAPLQRRWPHSLVLVARRAVAT